MNCFLHCAHGQRKAKRLHQYAFCPRHWNHNALQMVSRILTSRNPLLNLLVTDGSISASQKAATNRHYGDDILRRPRWESAACTHCPASQLQKRLIFFICSAKEPQNTMVKPPPMGDCRSMQVQRVLDVCHTGQHRCCFRYAVA